MSNDEVKWAAGFFDGEGTAYLSKRGAARYLQLGVSQVHIEPLLRLVAAVGGSITGPRVRGTNRSPIHEWRATGAEARRIAALLLPEVCEPKRAQLQRCLDGVVLLGRTPRRVQHGTANEYLYGKCRCSLCRAALAAKARDRRARLRQAP